jgi:hypothetical protein
MGKISRIIVYNWRPRNCAVKFALTIFGLAGDAAAFFWGARIKRDFLTLAQH